MKESQKNPSRDPEALFEKSLTEFRVESLRVTLKESMKESCKTQ